MYPVDFALSPRHPAKDLRVALFSRSNQFSRPQSAIGAECWLHCIHVSSMLASLGLLCNLVRLLPTSNRAEQRMTSPAAVSDAL